MWCTLYIFVLYYVLFVVNNLLFVGDYLINNVTMQIMRIIIIYYALFYFAICKFKKCINASCASFFIIKCNSKYTQMYNITSSSKRC